jgi:hypothetical protein
LKRSTAGTGRQKAKARSKKDFPGAERFLLENFPGADHSAGGKARGRLDA